MIRIEDLRVTYSANGEEVHAVRGVSIDVARGEFYTLLGPSGCGKTTTLRCLAGLERPSGGRILIDGKPVVSMAEGLVVPAHKRQIGMVFQSYAIWPHLTVFDNVAFPLMEMSPRPDKATIKRRVEEALSLVQLSGYEDRPAPFLSGGQQQRLALARAIVREAPVVLLDEPLSNLDAKLRGETRRELRSLVKRLDMTAIYVTHDQIEALTMSDRVAVMSQGVIVQEAPPREIYDRPSSRFVASFIGQSNFVDGVIAGIDANGGGTVETALGRLQFSEVAPGIAQGQKVTVTLRPENLFIANGQSDNVFSGTVGEVTFLGETQEVTTGTAAGDITLRVHPSSTIATGSTVTIHAPIEAVRILLD
jgi:iron(III) transport system ATP-binding protein